MKDINSSVCGVITNGAIFGLDFDLEIGKAYRLKYKDSTMGDIDAILSFVNITENESTLIFFSICGVNVSDYGGTKSFILRNIASTKYLYPKHFMVNVKMQDIITGEIDVVKLEEVK